MRVNSCYCRGELSVTASGTRECEPASVSASWLGCEQGVSQVNTAIVGPFLDHQTSQLHPIIANIEYLLYPEYNNCTVLLVIEHLQGLSALLKSTSVCC